MTKSSAPIDPDNRETCGVIMPISTMGPYDSNHWSDVREVIYRAAEAAGMKPQMVSDSLETDIIQERIVLNLYQNPMVICDVSGLNPNVMFELGMRLTFKKPTIVITDDLSSLPFDTRVIEHIAYPKTLRFHQIEEFIKLLTSKIGELRERSKRGSYKSFIESFGKFDIVQPDTQNIGIDKYVIERLDQVAASIRRIERAQNVDPTRTTNAFESLERNALAHYSTSSKRNYRTYSYTITDGMDRLKDIFRTIYAISGVIDLNLSYASDENPRLIVLIDGASAKRTEAAIRDTLTSNGISYIPF